MDGQGHAGAPRVFPAGAFTLYREPVARRGPRPRPAEARATRPTRVLAITEYFLPGFRAGGPVRALSNLARLMEGEVELSVLCRDRDCFDERPYPGVAIDAWTEHDGIPVRYVSPGARTLHGLAEALASREYDVLYLNSLWGPLTRSILTLRRLGRIADRPVILAPRGELAAGALRVRTGRKLAYLAAARAAGLLDGVVWQATSPAEAEDIARRVGPRAPVLLAQDPAPATASDAPRPAKVPGELRVVYLSRLSRSKNLLGAIEAVRGVAGKIVFDVYGTVEEEAYLERCLGAMAEVPGNVVATFHGPVEPHRVEETLARSHVFILPTYSENFGYAIVEAMRAGCVPLITDQTPWRQLAEARAGWDVPVGDVEAMRAALRQAVAMDDAEWRAWADGARAYAARAVRPGEAREAFLAVLRRALEPAPRPAGLGWFRGRERVPAAA